MVPALVAGLARFYVGVGVERVPLSAVVSAELLDRWEEVARGAATQAWVTTTIRDLVGRDADLEVSMGHGDLVRTNMLMTGSDVVLVDWEHARPMPIAFDLAKPVFLSSDPASTVEVIHATLSGQIASARSSYSLKEQLALAFIQMLSWSARRRHRAASAGRAGFLERDSRSRLALLEQLLS